MAYLLRSVDWTAPFSPVAITGRPDGSHGKGLSVKNYNQNSLGVRRYQVEIGYRQGYGVLDLAVN